MMHLGDRAQYRIVGEPVQPLAASPADPTLEDGYVWLMRDRRQSGVEGPA
ncbi:MAG TPA: hypothetical protein VGP82_04570 [Ktedonobacterales bacterium]|jgi:hypothetical protein|nr:hypothetical protein [Ktedonobacterales bacterium]